MSSQSAYRPADTSAELIDHTVGELLALRAAAKPDQVALVGVRHGDGRPRRLTYQELDREARAVAAALRTRLPVGAHIAVWAPNVVEWPIIAYGVALAGMVLVAIDPTLRPTELEFALRQSDTGLLLHADAYRGYDMAAAASEVCAALPTHRLSLTEFFAEPVAEESVEPWNGECSEVAMLQFTSGTTGTPKAVVLRHRSIINVAKLTVEAAGVKEGAVCLSPLPMFHTAGCVISMLGPLWVGGTLVLMDRFDAGEVLEAIVDEGVDVFFYVPALLAALTRLQIESPRQGVTLELMMGGASQVPASLIDDAMTAFGGSVINLYGQTELAPVLSLTRPDDARGDQLGTVGRPLPHVDCKVVDPGSGALRGMGEVGEICARGYQQFVEYWKDPGATAAALDADGFVRTGDLGSMDERGFLTIVGRLKEIIDRGGENVSPVEVETAMSGCDGLADCVVIGLPDYRLGQQVAAVVVFDGSVGHLPLAVSDLEFYARARLSPHKIPRRWFVADELPKTATGKVRRVVVRDAVLAGGFTQM
ncbi:MULTISPECIES: class I adenylate-forming enzyme family protein [Mycolicibacterium]|uniref:Long-chain fatty acid--CoA ligase n=2 Tax=Mycolicibacterium TaxID=1866885 RepID=A0A4Z0HW15_MYCPR|nr:MULTISPECIES: class I adenylate-forming enzyme family protein [Mycolicibacterium]CDO30943.1 long chain fatty acid-CoA ligase [Mycolicibacterium vulneris]MCV7388722.1 acyl--CoA ligase [Mycolicibacterium porcinum]ORB34832.1 long-chain fatty acid--CoA ligase [Mycolicibacterium porcinum]TGB45513.1 long-chain fatty acid--CoA ligase [Mycolicibacterium peregrinum]TGB47757.1 long-chain fatty acid--CoA ligase [Mycolicibacterium peregrinum]